MLNSGDTPPAVWDMRAKVENLREKLEVQRGRGYSAHVFNVFAFWCCARL